MRIGRIAGKQVLVIIAYRGKNEIKARIYSEGSLRANKLNDFFLEKAQMDQIALFLIIYVIVL